MLAVEEEEDEEVDAGTWAAALFSTESGDEDDEEVDAGTWAAALFSTEEDEDEEVDAGTWAAALFSTRDDDEEEVAGTEAAALLSSTLLVIMSGLSIPVGRERESATTLALPSKYLKSVVYSAIADN